MEYKKLGDIATFINGYAFKPSDRGEVGLPIIRIQDLTGNGYDLGFYNGEYPKKVEINNGDILISWSASLGVYVWNNGKALLNQHIFKVVFDKVEIDKYYFVFAIQYYLDEMKRKTHGATMKHIVKKDFDCTLIPYPSVEKQREISNILLKVKYIIDTRKKQLEKYDELIKARFVEMFGDFERNSMGWEIQPFSYFASIDGNMTTDFDKYADYPHIGVGNIEKDTGNLIDYKTIREDNVISGKYLFTPEHIIYSKIRPNLNKVALPAFEGLCSADAYPILPKKENCNRIFLAIAMRSDYFLGYILQFSSRTNMPKVNRKEISSFKMPLPPLSLQNDFADFVKLIYKSKFVVQKSLDKAQLLFDSLMQEYFG